MKKEIQRAGERGRGDHGWLESRFSFSFADWYDPSRMGFGALRVINDDLIAPLGKFGMHPHQNFEIITVPLAGAVTHEDSMGNKGVVSAGEVQVMSAGTGVIHSEYNASTTTPLALFQIWIAPRALGAAPRYAQKTFDFALRKDTWQLLVAEDGIPEALSIYQDARILRADLTADTPLSYSIAHSGNGAYLLVIEGEVEVDGEHLKRRDAIGLSDLTEFSVSALTSAQVLLIEVPLSE